MLLDIVPSNNTLDMSSALVALNSVMLLIMGWILREWYADIKRNNARSDRTAQELALFKQKTEDEIRLLTTVMKNDNQKLSEGFDRLEKKIDKMNGHGKH